MPKVFQIGFNKCGTRTIHQFFLKQGLQSVHWDRGRFAVRVFRNLMDGHDLLAGYEENDLFTDMEYITRDVALEVFKLFPLLARAYPDSRFILNTRDREDWIKSRSHHGYGGYMRKWEHITGLTGEALSDYWRADWDRHYARVNEFFAKEPHRLVTFDIAKDSPQLLADLMPEHTFDLSLYQIVGSTPQRKKKRRDQEEAEGVDDMEEAELAAE